jgi:ATP-dependent RNA helicase SUPV3L1/SUV3
MLQASRAAADAAAGHAADDGDRPESMSISPTAVAVGGRNVVAVLGPTNTGKTHLAIERMLGHASGVIGLPLRLLAREVYNRVAERVGADQVALITGEERIVPPQPRFRVCTVEALPTEVDAAFLAIDEVQLAGDLERGHVFTDRILNLRGREETLLLGAATMRSIVEKLLPGVNVLTRPRMSVLSYSGSKKITRLPRRSAVVAFSADEVYAIAELIRRQRGGAAVVLGSLSPRTRNAQVEIFQSGDVDFLVATDAIGMGLNLDVDHVAFAADRKFDGYQYRRLTAAELGQIAGRAGRHMRDGTFGVTGRVDPFEDALVEALESHRFDQIKTIQWRNRNLDFASIDALKASLDEVPAREGLTKAPPAEDVAALDTAVRDEGVRALAEGAARVALLWDVCQVPDYRKIAPANHAELVTTLFRFIARDGVIAEDWFAGQVAYADRTDGDIDTLANRIAHIRTWTFAANRPSWLRDPAHWQERTRAIEDRLSDALHERLTGRFIDRRTSVLMRRLKENAMLEAEVTPSGDVLVEGQHVGQLDGFRFAPDPSADGPDGKALRLAAQKALAGEIGERAARVATASNADLILSNDGTLRWRGSAIARLVEGDDALKPRLILLADDALPQAARERVQARIELWLATHAETLLKPLFDLRAAETLTPLARGIAYRLVENYGVLDRSEVADDIKALDQEARAGMRMLGVRFGAYSIYVPQLLKPGPSSLLAMLWALKHGGLDAGGVATLTQLAASGRTSVPLDAELPRPLYRVVGYRIAGTRAVRIDILERLADLIRPLIAWRATPASPVPPEGAADGNGFKVTVAMTSLLGCSGEDFASVLRALNYRCERRPAPPAATAAPDPTAAAPPDPAAAVAPDPASPVPAEGSGGPDQEAMPAEPDAMATTPEIEGEAGPEPAIAADTAPLPAAATPADGGTDGDALPVPDAAAIAVPTLPAEAAAAAAPAAGEGATAAAAGEPAFVEIWRPARPDRHAPRREPRHRDRQHRPRPSRPAPAVAAPAAAAGDRGSQAEAASRPAEAPAPGGTGRGKGKPPRNERPERPRPHTHRPERPERRERQPDPDSPFAALAALKAELEARKRDG